MEGRRRVVCGATQATGLLAFIYLFYTQSFGFDPLKLWFGTQRLLKWNATMEQVGVFENSLQQKFISLTGEDHLQKLKTTGFTCDSTLNSVVCVASNPVRIDTKTMAVYIPTQFNSTNLTNFSLQEEEKVLQVRPYAWAQSVVLKDYVTPVTFRHEPPQTPTTYCDFNHTIPAIVFSSGGFTGNLFHEFNEIIIPLFLTSSLFEARVQFVLVDYSPYLVKKYNRVFSSLSSYNVLNPMINTSIHCFPGAIIGLKFHSYLAINSSLVPKGNSMLEFKKFIKTTYDLKTTNVSDNVKTTPRLLLISRRKTRMFLNEDELVDLMEELGFEVIVVRSIKKMSNLDKFSKLVSTCSVLVGAHGAGITNLMFLPVGAVVVQVVPLGLEWPSTAYFSEPTLGMGLHYLDYKIGPNESSLIDLYPRDDPVISDPLSLFAKGYYVGKEMYLDKQNINVDVNRFKATLIEALRLLGK